MTAITWAFHSEGPREGHLTVEARYQSNDSGTFQHLTPGFWITLRDAMVMMIIVSDNTCTGMVTDLVGLPNLQHWCEHVGMTATIHRYGIPPKLSADHALDTVTITTPNDQGLLLELILKGTTDPAVATMIRQGRTHEISSAIDMGSGDGPGIVGFRRLTRHDQISRRVGAVSERSKNIRHMLAAVFRVADQTLVLHIDDEIQ